MSSSSTLADLAEAIVTAFGFDRDHAYGFYSKLTGKLFDSPQRFELFAGSGSRSMKGTCVTTAFQKMGSAMTFLYDYEWRFRVEDTGTGQAQPRCQLPEHRQQDR
ncbi:plasmid pRiA4b ORF-3 family protein [Mesorhizobium sp. M0018]|uniref:IS1096 element passenger TnpR family protein n=1 Tax=Mesorhizobium sp. M0018 TaxID=2956844 RepID=UPI0033362435